MRLAPRTLAALMMIVGIPSAAWAGPTGYYGSVGQYAHQLHDQTHILITEVNIHLKNTYEFRHIISDLQELDRLVQQVEHLAHTRCKTYKLKRKVRQVTNLFHHTKWTIEEVFHAQPYQHMSYGAHHDDHVSELLCAMDATVHQLQRAVRRVPRIECYQPIQVYPHPHSHGLYPNYFGKGKKSRIGFRIGNFRISL